MAKWWDVSKFGDDAASSVNSWCPGKVVQVSAPPFALLLGWSHAESVMTAAAACPARLNSTSAVGITVSPASSQLMGGSCSKVRIKLVRCLFLVAVYPNLIARSQGPEGP